MAISQIPAIPPFAGFPPRATDVHPIHAAAREVRNLLMDATDAGLKGHGVGTAESLASSLDYYTALLAVEFKDRQKNLISASFSAGRLSGVAQENSRRGSERQRHLFNQVWIKANEIIRALGDVDWSGSLLVVKRPCGCAVEKLSDTDPGAHLINCDEARALNGHAHDVWGDAMAAEMIHQGNPGLIADKHQRHAAAYKAFQRHFGGA